MLVSDRSSTTSKFVESTPLHNEQSEPDKQKEVTIETQQNPDNVRKDIEFLNQAWANMAENAKDEGRFFTKLERDDELPINTIFSEDFQQISRKSKKKKE